MLPPTRESAPGQAVPRLHDPRGPCGGHPLGARRVAHDLVLAAPLRLVHRGVHGGQQLLDGLAVVRERDQAQRHGGANGAVLDADGQRGDVATQLLGDHEGALRVRLRQQHHELVAAVSAGQVGRPDGPQDHVGDGPQQLVPAGCPNVSLTGLRSSRSSITTQKPRPVRSTRLISRSTAVKNAPRL